MATATLRDEATGLLQELLRLDTTNPPGNETPAAALLRDYLDAAGLECELYAAEPDRANLVARLPGRGAGKRRTAEHDHSSTFTSRNMPASMWYSRWQ